MKWVSRRVALTLGAGGLSALAGCDGLGGIAGSSNGAPQVDRIVVGTPGDSTYGPFAGVASIVRVMFDDPQATGEVEVVLRNGDETLETWSASVEGTKEWSTRYTFPSPGEYEVTAGDATKTVSISDQVDLEREYRSGAQFAASAERDKGVVSAWLTVDNKSDVPVPFHPRVEIGGDAVDTLYHYDDGTGDVFDGELEHERSHSLVARKVVDAGTTYEVTVDGETVGTASLERRDVPTRDGTPARTGPPLPFSGIGRQPELAERFRIDRPTGIPDDAELEEMVPLAVAGDRLYLRCRWGNSIQSIGAYHRWNGEGYWHGPVGSPADLAATEDGEFLLSGGTVLARGADGEELWRKEVHDGGYNHDGPSLVPSQGVLYVATPGEVLAIDLETGDIQARMDGTSFAVGEEAIFTWQGTMVRRFDRSTHERSWETQLVTEPTSVGGSGAEGEHVFTHHGLVAEGTLVAFSLVEDAENTRYLADGYDVESGDRKWRQTVERPESVNVGSARTNESAWITNWGGNGPQRIYPRVTQPVAREGAFHVGTTSGYRSYELETGKQQPWMLVTHGTNPIVANLQHVYFGTPAGLYAPIPWPKGAGGEEDQLVVEVPDDSDRETPTAHTMFGRDAVYLLSDGYVNVIGGTVPELPGEDDGT